MSAFAVAERLLGDMRLSVGQLTQLRAIDRKYQQRLFGLLHAPERADPPSRAGADGERREAAIEAGPTRAEIAALDEMTAADILEMLTAEQRAQLGY